MFVDQFDIPAVDQPLVEAVFLLDDGWHDVDRASFRFVPGAIAEWREKKRKVACRPNVVLAARFRERP